VFGKKKTRRQLMPATPLANALRIREVKGRALRFGLLAAGVAVGVAVGAAGALVARRRRAPWDDYDPTASFESVTEHAKSSVG
jgi:hypothetical protein